MSAQDPTLFELLSQCLSREEWKLCFLLDTLACSEDYGPHFSALPRFASPSGEDPRKYPVESFRRIIRWLSHDFGFTWDGLSPQHDGAILGRPVAEGVGNVYYVGMLASGQCPDLLDAARVALLLLEERAPGFDREVVRAAQADFARAAAGARAAAERIAEDDPERAQQVDDFSDAALAAVGVVRSERIVN